MIITPTQRIDVEIIPEILQMPIYYLEQNGYIPLAFFTELGALEEDIKAIVENSSFNESSILKVQINEQDGVLVISHDLASWLITQLAVMPQYSIFASISRKLLLKSFESGAITVDDFADDFRQDSVFWHSKISDLPTQIDSLKPTFITPHPQVDFATISRLDDKELHAYLDLNPAYISYKFMPISTLIPPISATKLLNFFVIANCL